MEDIGLLALDEATRRGASYADVRAMRRRQERFQARDGALERAGEEWDEGVGVRVLVGGAWGFAATAGLDREGIAPAVRRAVEAARAASRVIRRRVELAPNAPAVAEYRTPIERDPFAVSFEE
ncbi:MAG: TldD/PmbA family protein, partial [Chloroflexi bacterium]|nr:TldD/PmbA family protein [Chloroflexota bacterium]